MRQPFALLLSDALACVARECPAAYREMRETLGQRRVGLCVGDERLLVSLSDAGGEVSTADGAAEVRVHASERTVHALLCSQADVLECLLDDTLFVQGVADELLAVADAMTFFIKGAVRCASTPNLLERLERRIHHSEGSP